VFDDPLHAAIITAPATDAAASQGMRFIGVSWNWARGTQRNVRRRRSPACRNEVNGRSNIATARRRSDRDERAALTLAAMASRVLVVEDDTVIGDGLAQALSGEGYQVRWARTAADALDAIDATPPDLVLLDLGLPDLDGVELCRRLRAALPLVTIVMLTARVEEVDIVVGLDAGGDDYMTKPFRRAELLARIRAHLRRGTTAADQPLIEVGTLTVDVAARRAVLDGDEIELRSKEFDLLTVLTADAGRVVTRERLMAEVWDEHWFGSTKTLDMHVSSLRKKLTSAGDVITTIRGVGYRYERP